MHFLYKYSQIALSGQQPATKPDLNQTSNSLLIFFCNYVLFYVIYIYLFYVIRGITEGIPFAASSGSLRGVKRTPIQVVIENSVGPSIYELKRLLYLSVTVEWRHKIAAVQCYKCHRFGHVNTGCIHCQSHCRGQWKKDEAEDQPNEHETSRNSVSTGRPATGQLQRPNQHWSVKNINASVELCIRWSY